MGRPKRRYVCQVCGSIATRWQGQCADCGEWNTLTEEAPETVFSARHNLASGGRPIMFEPLDAPGEQLRRRSTGLAEFDRALGGGLVPGSAVLMSGDPGIGKSTLLMQAAARMAQTGKSAVYISGEEAAGQIRLRAERLGLAKAPVQLAAATSVRDILTTLGGMTPPSLLVIDSIQTMHSDQIEGAPGTVSQVRGCAFELIRYAKENGVVLFLVGHVTKDGSIAGPRVLEHMVDVVMSFEGERSHQYRILRSLKNRFGPVDEIGVFAMAGAGLEEVANPSMLFLSGREEPVPGSAVFPAMEGTRPVLVEVQALIVRLASGATPRRAVVGWDSGRLAMLLAVLEARCGLNFSVGRGLSQRRRRLPADRSRRRSRGRRRAGVGAGRKAAAGRLGMVRRSLAGGRSAPGRPCRHPPARSGQARFRHGPWPGGSGARARAILCYNSLTLLPNLVDRIFTRE